MRKILAAVLFCWAAFAQALPDTLPVYIFGTVNGAKRDARNGTLRIAGLSSDGKSRHLHIYSENNRDHYASVQVNEASFNVAVDRLTNKPPNMANIYCGPEGGNWTGAVLADRFAIHIDGELNLIRLLVLVQPATLTIENDQLSYIGEGAPTPIGYEEVHNRLWRVGLDKLEMLIKGHSAAKEGRLQLALTTVDTLQVDVKPKRKLVTINGLPAIPQTVVDVTSGGCRESVSYSFRIPPPHTPQGDATPVIRRDGSDEAGGN